MRCANLCSWGAHFNSITSAMSIHFHKRAIVNWISLLVAIAIYLNLTRQSYYASNFEPLAFNYTEILRSLIKDGSDVRNVSSTSDACNTRWHKVELKNISSFRWYGTRTDFTLQYTHWFDTSRSSSNLLATSSNENGKSSHSCFLYLYFLVSFVSVTNLDLAC